MFDQYTPNLCVWTLRSEEYFEDVKVEFLGTEGASLAMNLQYIHTPETQQSNFSLLDSLGESGYVFS